MPGLWPTPERRRWGIQFSPDSSGCRAGSRRRGMRNRARRLAYHPRSGIPLRVPCALRNRLLSFCLCLVLAGCTSLSGQRLARSSYGCMEAVVREKVSADLSDQRKHCIAAGLIARYCSATEAYLAGSGKELSDLLGSGDAAWSDWQADRAGVRCARTSASDEDVAACCVSAGY